MKSQPGGSHARFGHSSWSSSQAAEEAGPWIQKFPKTKLHGFSPPNLPRLDEFEAGVPVVQINPRKALGDLGDWEDEDDYPAVPVRMTTSMTLLKGCLVACHWENILTVCLGTARI